MLLVRLDDRNRLCEVARGSLAARCRDSVIVLYLHGFCSFWPETSRFGIAVMVKWTAVKLRNSQYTFGLSSTQRWKSGSRQMRVLVCTQDRDFLGAHAWSVLRA